MKTKEKHTSPTLRETTYCMTVRNKKIYGITARQLKELYQTMGRFIEREKAPFDCPLLKEATDYRIYCSKNITLFSDEDCFQVDYSVGTFDGDIVSLSAERMKRTALAILGFLQLYGENGDRQLHWDITEYPPEKQKAIRFSLKEDYSTPAGEADASYVSKTIHQEEHEKAKIKYSFSINDSYSPLLSFGELVALYRKLEDFFK